MKQCPICHSKSVAVRYPQVTSVYSAHSYDVAHCDDCGHFFTSPAPTSAELDDIYTNRYSYDAHALIDGEKVMRARNYAKYIKELGLGKNALEVGCMHGLLLTELRDLGIKVEGVELDADAVEVCKSKGLNVQQSSVEKYLTASPNQHDIIIMSHVIEHLADPEAQLTELAATLSDSGSLVLVTPNSKARTAKLFGRYWGYWQVPVHINHFNDSSMTELLKRSGYEVREMKFYGGDSLFFLSSLANRLGANNDTKSLSGAKKLLVRIATVVLRPWYYVGAEDMVVVASKAK